MGKKKSISQKTVKDTWNSSLLKKIKFWEGIMKLHEKWKKVLKQNSTVLNKTVVNVLFNKVLSENEKRVFYFYLKKQRNSLVSSILFVITGHTSKHFS